MRDVELVALQLRKILEALVFANLSANIETYQEMFQSYYTDWNMTKIIERIRKINPSYYPVPIIRPEVTKNTDELAEFFVEPITQDFLTEDEVKCTKKYLDKLLHADNPFNTNLRSVKDELDRLEKFLIKITNLLRTHQTKLINGVIIHCEMNFFETSHKLTIVDFVPMEGAVKNE